MAAPSKHLERTRGRILAESEGLRVASRVLVVGSVGAIVQRRRNRALLALTDRRLLLVSETLRASRASVLASWPTRGLMITVSKPKLGNSVIQVVASDGTEARFEWLDGHSAREWACYRYRL